MEAAILSSPPGKCKHCRRADALSRHPVAQIGTTLMTVGQATRSCCEAYGANAFSPIHKLCVSVITEARFPSVRFRLAGVMLLLGTSFSMTSNWLWLK